MLAEINKIDFFSCLLWSPGQHGPKLVTPSIVKIVKWDTDGCASAELGGSVFTLAVLALKSSATE